MTNNPVIFIIFGIIYSSSLFRTFWLWELYKSFLKKFAKDLRRIRLKIRIFILFRACKHRVSISWRCNWSIIVELFSIVGNCELHTSRARVASSWNVLGLFTCKAYSISHYMPWAHILTSKVSKRRSLHSRLRDLQRLMQLRTDSSFYRLVLISSARLTTRWVL